MRDTLEHRSEAVIYWAEKLAAMPENGGLTPREIERRLRDQVRAGEIKINFEKTADGYQYRLQRVPKHEAG